ncbi:MAG: sulfotransferase domain-containing protein [Planctomycetales bacterium]|nr:sulfotransferase domain-containing protein [Planctomycetales bacterium]
MSDHETISEPTVDANLEAAPGASAAPASEPTPAPAAAPQPNFFLIGAPKCGTTALAQYLSEHAQVFFANPKEPFFFSDDYPILREVHQMETLEAYLKLYSAAQPHHRAIGEGSTNYLNSEVAIQNILAFNAEAKFLVMLRDPVEVAHAFHGTLVYSFNEDERNFEKAWHLQAARRAGRAIPKTCRAPQFLQYGDVARFGEQMERFLDLVPAPQRKIILFEDFVRNTRRSYCEVERFLGLDDDGRDKFPPVHGARTHRMAWLHKFFKRPPQKLAGPILSLRRAMNNRQRGLVPYLKSKLHVRQQRDKLRPGFEEELRRFFEDDVRRLESLLQWDLKHWITGKRSAKR